MIIKSEFLKQNKSIDQYTKEQNIVANCELDQTKRVNYIKEYFNENTKTILDIGCRDGKFIKRYSDKYIIYGIDIGDNAIKRSIKNFGKGFVEKFIKIGDIQDKGIINMFDYKFDFINFSHVIEHLLDPVKALNIIKELMNENSRMLIIIPGDVPRFKTIEKCIKGQPYHEVFWKNTSDIEGFLKTNGFKILKLDEINLGKIDGEWRILVKLDFSKDKIYHNEVIIPNSKKPVNNYKNYSMLSNSRIINLLNKCTELNKKFDDGIAIECGVANGGSLQVMREYFSENISIYGFDSFSNMPPLTEKDENDARAIKMNFNITNNKLVGNIYGNKEKCIAGFKKNSIPMENVKLIEGYFEETIPSLIDELNNIILLRLDADWYQSTYYLLDTLYDKVVKGGVIIIDDFYAYVGCRKAVIDFFNNRKIDLPYIFHTYEKGLTTITGGTEIFWYK